MTPQNMETRLNELLARDAQLSRYWTDPPHTYIDDTPGSPANDVAVIWLCVGKKSMSRSILWSITRHVIELAAPIAAASGLRQVHVVPRLYDGVGQPARLYRLAVDMQAFDTVLKLTAADIERPKPTLGVECFWFSNPEQLAP